MSNQSSDVEYETTSPILMPIVEEIRPEESQEVAHTSSESNYDEPESDKNDKSAAVKKRKHKKSKSDSLSLTPPSKLLIRCEKKIAKYKQNRMVDKAIEELVRCTALSRIVYGEGHWKLAKAYVQLADAYFHFKNYVLQAVYHCENARNAMLSAVQMTESQLEKANILDVLMRIYLTLGRAFMAQKKYCDSEQALAKADKISQQRSQMSCVSSKESTNWQIKIATLLGRLNANEKKFAISSSYLETAIDLTIKHCGNDSIGLIPIYQDLGHVEQAKGKHANHDRAIEMFLQAHSIASANYSEGSVELAETACVLANAYSNVGQMDADTSAESYLLEALTTYQSEYGPNHEKTLTVNDEMARLAVRMECQEEAIAILRRSLSAKTEVFGPFCDQVADTHKMIGSIHLSQSQLTKALKAFRKCYSIESTSYGAHHRRTRESLRTIDLLMANPAIANSMTKSRTEEISSRPRFNTIIR